MGGTVYECPRCGGLVDVEHDLDTLKERSAEEWKSLFRERSAAAAWPMSSGVWSRRELVLPSIRDEHIVSLGEGRTPLVPLPRLARALALRELWVKQCGTSATGSFKDLGMTVLVSAVRQAISDGAPLRAVACASTGDTSAALAAYGAAAGIPTIVFLPRGKVTPAQLAQPLANGAIVLALDGDFDDCMRVVRDVTADRTIYLANSLNALRIEGQKTVAIEIAEQLGWSVPDWVVVPCGNLGNVAAIGKGFLLLRELDLIDRLPRIAAAQAQNADPLYRSYQTDFRRFDPQQARATLATAIQIGNPVSYERAVLVLRQLDGVVEHASEEELSIAAARADLNGTYACPQTGVALACLEKLVAKRTVRVGESVVVVSTAHGLKFTAFKAGGPEQGLSGGGTRRREPIELRANANVVMDRIDRELAGLGRE
ncbi:MAG: threonine synthase [Candidatus Bipolaricaulis sp.]|nr:threonine synthase [Candidatus Bipolaricaulis sp.]